jgi:hypothetical protein
MTGASFDKQTRHRSTNTAETTDENVGGIMRQTEALKTLGNDLEVISTR